MLHVYLERSQRVHDILNSRIASTTTDVIVFTALHGMQTLSYDEISVRPSVCPSVKRVHCDKTEERYVLDFYITRKNIYPSFLRRRMVGGGDPFYLKFWVNRPALERNRRF